MFGISFEELIVLLILALILFGPEKLPEYAEKLGRMVAKLRQASSELTSSLNTSPYPQPPPTLREGFCPQCGHHVGPDFVFCSKCGRRLKDEPVDAKPLAS